MAVAFGLEIGAFFATDYGLSVWLTAFLGILGGAVWVASGVVRRRTRYLFHQEYNTTERRDARERDRAICFVLTLGQHGPRRRYIYEDSSYGTITTRCRFCKKRFLTELRPPDFTVTRPWLPMKKKGAKRTYGK
jgi:hypothetical protein